MIAGNDVIWCQPLTQERGNPSRAVPTGRIGLRNFATEMRVGLAMVLCQAPASIIRERLSKRTRSTRTSDSWEEVLERMQRDWEAPKYPHIVINTCSPDINFSEIINWVEESRKQPLG